MDKTKLRGGIKKLKVGFLNITGCAGCLLSFIFNEDEILDLITLIDIKAFPFVKEVNVKEGFDYIFLEGLVADRKDLEMLQDIRKNTTYLVALGACADTGCVPAYRGYTLKENYEHLMHRKEKDLETIDATPLEAHVKVDYVIPGCPPNKREILKFIKSIVNGQEPRTYIDPVCVECRRNKNLCLLDINKPCLGPITNGGCDAVCTNGGFECWGCRGPTKDMNLELMIQVLKQKGYDDKFIKDRMRTFVGLKLPMLERVMHGKDHNTESSDKN